MPDLPEDPVELELCFWTCNGKLHPRAHVEATIARREAAKKALDFAEVMKLTRFLRVISNVIEKDRAFTVREGATECREPCGFDCTPFVDALPRDGGDYAFHCPRCGQRHEVRTPAGDAPSA
jgi:hypothetical protein